MPDGGASSTRVLCPARPRLADVLACATIGGWQWHTALYDPTGATLEFRSDNVVVTYRDGARVIGSLVITDPAELWEALATRGVIPLEWVTAWDTKSPCGHRWRDILRDVWRTDAPCPECVRARAPARIFDHGEGCYPAEWPRNVAACVALASDPVGITQAEALAREAVARLAPWGAPQPHRVVWRVGAWDAQRSWLHQGPDQERIPDWRIALSTTSRGREFVETFRKHARALIAKPYVLDTVLTDNDQAIAWMLTHHDLYERESPNPWQPLCELFALGYALDAIRDDAVTLVCPALEGGQPAP